MDCICKHENPQGNDKRVCVKHRREVRVDSSVPRVAGYNLRSHKASGDLVVCSQQEAELYYKISARNHGIVAQGVRANKK